jgi:hypothetical protein
MCLIERKREGREGIEGIERERSEIHTERGKEGRRN